ncbi:MAG: hypothetical protein J6C96_09575 [Oscillospiraceae bacterium]|nr:hypothetical protein [Oscillospiraceae bacterium]
MEKIDSYIFYFNRICSIINNNKVIFADNTSERKNYDMTLSNERVDILGLGKAHYCLSYCFIAENIHSKRVKQLIYDAFINQ